jgi:hypothetical protein
MLLTARAPALQQASILYLRPFPCNWLCIVFRADSDASLMCRPNGLQRQLAAQANRTFWEGYRATAPLFDIIMDDGATAGPHIRRANVKGKTVRHKQTLWRYTETSAAGALCGHATLATGRPPASACGRSGHLLTVHDSAEILHDLMINL